MLAPVHDNLPTFAQLARLAPTSLLVTMLLGVGYWAGLKSRQETIDTLKSWLESVMRDKK